MLGHRPDECGLVPDGTGFIALKELIQALHEEKGFRYVRIADINEVMLGKKGVLFQQRGNQIRTVKRKWELDMERPLRSTPKILFSAVKRKVYPSIIENGWRPSPDKYLVLSLSKKMALRIGGRQDQNPVMIEIMSSEAVNNGVELYAFGDLFLSPHIPAVFISGPPLPKEHEVKNKKGLSWSSGYTAGTFTMRPSENPDLSGRSTKGKKQKGWKEAARKTRRK